MEMESAEVKHCLVGEQDPKVLLLAECEELSRRSTLKEALLEESTMTNRGFLVKGNRSPG